MSGRPKVIFILCIYQVGITIPVKNHSSGSRYYLITLCVL